MFSENIIITHFENTERTFVSSGSVSSSWIRPYSGIIIPLCGSFEFIFSDNSFIVDDSHPIFIPTGSVYHFVCTKQAESIVFNFQTSSSARDAVILDPISHQTVEEYHNSLYSENFYEYATLSKMYSFLHQIFDKNTSDNAELLIRQAESIMEKDFSTLNTRSLAVRLNISEVYLRKLFQRKRGISPGKVLFSVKMKKARELLEHGVSVSSTAAACGYCDIFQFSRAFKKYFGYPPSFSVKKMPRI